MRFFRWLDQLADDITANFWDKWVMLILIAVFSLGIVITIFFLILLGFFTFEMMFSPVGIFIALPIFITIIYFFFKLTTSSIEQLVLHY